MDMTLDRRQFARMIAGAGACASLVQLGRSAAVAAPVAGYKAMVGVFLFGGNDGWNMVVPTDNTRYTAYAAARGAGLALPQSSLVALTGANVGLHPAMQPLKSVWDEGGLGIVLNTGTLFAPLTKAQYQSSSNLRPLNLMSHSDEQAHWQGLRARDVNYDGFMGRLNDKAASANLPALMSFGGSNLAVLGKTSSPLILPSTGTTNRNGFTGSQTDAAIVARNDAVTAFADGASLGTVTDTTAKGISSAYAQNVTANSILTATSTVDQYFRNPTTGAALTSDVARQLNRVARMIEARGTLGHSRQTFFVTQGGYDNHSNQVTGDNTIGTQATLLGDLAMALTSFYVAMKQLGLGENVTAFTMSDFGRVYKANAQRGTDHAWGSNHLVVGGAVKPQSTFGAYPQPVLGGADDINTDGRFLPTTAQEEYIGAIAQWHGVSAGDLPYVFPNWSTWSTGGRGPLGLFR